jgi:hypothetical protein
VRDSGTRRLIRPSDKLPDRHDRGVDEQKPPVQILNQKARLEPMSEEFGRTHQDGQLAENPDTDNLYIARLIRAVGEGSGRILPPFHNFDIDNANLLVSYGDYLLHVEQPDNSINPPALSLMRNYAGQQARVPTMMLQEIQSPWGISGNVWGASEDNGFSLPMRFLRWQIDRTDACVASSPVRDIWEDMECVYFATGNGGNQKDRMAQEDLGELEEGESMITDIQANFARLDTEAAPVNPHNLPWINGIEDGEMLAENDARNEGFGVQLLARTFQRPWNILVNVELVSEMVQASRDSVLQNAQSLNLTTT